MKVSLHHLTREFGPTTQGAASLALRKKTQSRCSLVPCQSFLSLLTLALDADTMSPRQQTEDLDSVHIECVLQWPEEMSFLVWPRRWPGPEWGICGHLAFRPQLQQNNVLTTPTVQH